MKRFIFTTLITFLFTTSFSIAANDDKPKVVDINVCVDIGGEIGIKKKGCKGIGLSCLEWDVTVEITRFGPSKPGRQIIQFDAATRNQVTLTFFTSKSGDLELTDNLTLPDKISKGLGYNSITLLPGNYRCSKRSDGATVVTVSTTTK